MRLKNSALIVLLLMTASFAQNCTSGDCQKGTIAGPYTAAQVAEFSSTGVFPVCKSNSCTQGSWSGDQKEGIDAQQHIGTRYQFYDQAYNFDANIAVGPTVSGQNGQVLEWVNYNVVQAFDKLTGQPIFTNQGGTTAVPQSVLGLWSRSSQPECHTGSGNVQVIFDRMDRKFVMSRRTAFQVNGIAHYAWCIAVSSSSDLSSPSTQWYAYEYKMDTVLPCVPSSNNCTTGTTYDYFPDWPRIATWSNGFYITFDLTDPTAGYVQTGFEACQLDRADIAKGQPSNPITCYTYMIPPAEQPSLIHSVDVADIDSALAPADGEGEYFLSIVNPSNAQQGQSGTGWCTSKTTPCSSNQLAWFSWGSNGLVGPTFIAVNPYTPGCYDTSGSGTEFNTVCIPEPSTNTGDIGAYGMPFCGNYATPCVDSLGDRMSNRLTYNKQRGSGERPNGEYLTASHVVMEDPSTQRTGIRYYILKVSNGEASLLVNSGGSSGPSDLQDPNGVLFYFMPSAALDLHGNLALTFTSSGAYCSTCQTQPHPALSFDVLPWTGSNFNPPTLIVQGAGDEENTPRWGEYAATVIDSSDNLTYYGVGEYFNTSQTGTANCTMPSNDCYTWQTRIFRRKN
jgi:hypothetical protein